MELSLETLDRKHLLIVAIFAYWNRFETVGYISRKTKCSHPTAKIRVLELLELNWLVTDIIGTRTCYKLSKEAEDVLEKYKEYRKNLLIYSHEYVFDFEDDESLSFWR